MLTSNFWSREWYLVLSSCLLGWLLWSIIGESYYARLKIKVPFYFYNASPEQIQALKHPETISLELEGKRRELRSVNREELAVHVNYQTLTPPLTPIIPTASMLFLPPSINVISYRPENLAITTL
jgi:hypothetical protein